MKRFIFIAYKEDGQYYIDCINYKYLHTFSEKKSDIQAMAIDLAENAASDEYLYPKTNKNMQTDHVDMFTVVVDSETKKGTVQRVK